MKVQSPLTLKVVWEDWHLLTSHRGDKGGVFGGPVRQSVQVPVTQGFSIHLSAYIRLSEAVTWRFDELRKIRVV
jgi:hypothetical protein